MTVRSEISVRIEAFTAELEVLVRRAALEAVGAALGGGTVGPNAPTSTGRRRGRPAAKTMSSAKAAIAPTEPSAIKLTFKRKKGSKRTAEQLGQIDAAVLAYVKANAGNGVEQMAKALRVPSSDLKARVALLLDAKKIKKTGAKRGTKYFAG